VLFWLFVVMNTYSLFANNEYVAMGSILSALPVMWPQQKHTPQDGVW